MTDTQMDRYYDTGHMMDQQLQAPYLMAARLLLADTSFYFCRESREVTTALLAFLLLRVYACRHESSPIRRERWRWAEVVIVELE